MTVNAVTHYSISCNACGLRWGGAGADMICSERSAEEIIKAEGMITIIGKRRGEQDRHYCDDDCRREAQR